MGNNMVLVCVIYLFLHFDINRGKCMQKPRCFLYTSTYFKEDNRVSCKTGKGKKTQLVASTWIVAVSA